MFEKFPPKKNYVCNQGQTTIQIQAPTNVEAKWSSDEKQLEEILKTKLRLELTSLTIYSHWLVPQLEEILKIKLRLKLTSLTIYSHWLVKALTSNIFPHMLLTWS